MTEWRCIAVAANQVYNTLAKALVLLLERVCLRAMVLRGEWVSNDRV